MEGAVIYRWPAGWCRAPGIGGVAVWAAVVVGFIGWAGASGAPVHSAREGMVGATRSLAALPVGLQAVASSALGAEAKRFAVTRGPGRDLVATGGGLSTVFGRSGPVVHAGGSTLALSLVRVGRGSDVSRPSAASALAAGNRVSYRRGSVVEWYRNGPLG